MKNSYIFAIIIIAIIAFISIDVIDSQTIKQDGDLKYIVDPSTLLDGGVPKGGIGVNGGIPALDEPKFENASDVSWSDDEIVLGLNHNGVKKAYPLKIMQWHEIANDYANDPIIVTYCPLCMSGVAFKNEINGERVRFGVSGKLMNSNLVMYDEKTNSYWNQLTGQAIVGELSGYELERIRLSPSTWGAWKEKHPDTLILSRDTGFSRNYDTIAYENYFNSDSTFGTPFTDNRLEVKEIVYPVEINNETKVYSETLIKELGEINDTIGNSEIRIIYNGTINIFVDGEEYDTFTTFWFSWVAFKPESMVYVV